MLVNAHHLLFVARQELLLARHSQLAVTVQLYLSRRKSGFQAREKHRWNDRIDQEINRLFRLFTAYPLAKNGCAEHIRSNQTRIRS